MVQTLAHDGHEVSTTLHFTLFALGETPFLWNVLFNSLELFHNLFIN